ncbi:MAG: hypothetical protein U0531_17100 [Dehalococcoidia bacterium]
MTDQVAGAMARLVDEGLVRHAGLTGLGDTPSVHGVVRSGRFATVQAYFNAIDPSAGYPGAAGGGRTSTA